MATATRELLWGLPAVSQEIHAWRARAAAMPESPLREDALDSLEDKREHAEGAALFWVLPRSRDRRLLRLLVAYQTLWDFLDNLSERETIEANGRQLHLALVEALDPRAPISDYYRHHPWKDDGGYLRALVEACRESCAALPSYARVRPHVLAGVRRCSVQSLNHATAPGRRDAALKAWAGREFPEERAMCWFELTAAASAFTPHALLALAAEPSCEDGEIARACAAYFPWTSLAIAMLDSYVDRREDALCGNHSYISHYDDDELALRRLCEIVERTVREANGLRNGHRHAVIAGCMVAMYLSRDGADTPETRARRRALAEAGGSLTRLLLPLLRIWRSVYLRRSKRGRTRGRVCEWARGLARVWERVRAGTWGRGRGRARWRARSVSQAATGEPSPALPLPRAVQTFLFWRWPFAYLERCRRSYGTSFTLRATSRPPLVFLSDLGEIKAMLTAPADVLHPGEGAGTIEPLVGEQSFMLCEEEEHLNGRKVILPPFHAKVVREHAELVAEITRREVASWPRGIPFAVHPRLRALTLETVLRTIVGATGGLSDERLYELRDRLLAMLSVTGSTVFPEPMLRHGPGRRIWKRFLRDQAAVDELIYEMIEDWDRKPGGGDLLGRLLGAHNTDGSTMSPRQVRDHLMSIVLAGHETTASELAWAFQLLAHNPAVHDRLIEELDGGSGDEYLTATIQEVLRHRPVFLFTIPRSVKQPIEIGGRGYGPPTQLLGCIYLLHHDAELYPEPQKFRPERFLESSPTTYTWLPWGGGRKRCPGLHLATLEMKTVLRTVLASMTVRPAGRKMEHPRWRSVIVTPHAGSRVVLDRRR